VLLPATIVGVRQSDAQNAPSIVAPHYEELPVNEALKRQQQAIHQTMAEGKFADPQAQAAFDAYYTDYLLARWTQLKNISSLPDLRLKGLRGDLRAARSGEVHDHLNDLVLAFMTKLMTGPYHAAVRINAVLAIGELNSVEPVVGTPAVPLPDALRTLLATVESAKASDALRAAAMVGVMRHADARGREEDVRRTITSAMLRIVAEAPAAGASAQGREWIRCQALETLGILGAVGDDDAVAKAMIKTVADTKLPIGVRTCAAESLAKLDYAAAGKIDAAEAAAALGQLAIDACNDELQRPTSTPGLSLRRRLLQRLDAVLAALNGNGEEGRKGILPLARDNQTEFVSALQKDVKEVADLLDDHRHDNDDMKPQAEALRKKLEGWIKTKPA
jgi:hypothetical protein